ncbi:MULTISPECIES: M48 family metalloprotease [unclassified Sphingomonas]|uniref:M48 family metalloprotease n=1 Tax=unclassified Sphingomonas TaxID=196159 RepID=UPI002866F6A9|nr:MULTISPECIES: M48 family metalloprotease [unclassified Sphingomonas]MDR6114092.1 putative Zn-dependent protease [Sphingomonas sp. SORGH_AS_0789]MDR6148548.1 putative Zn-dependent protease [Sphingomonas sp. SORGH_AS_0742]
MRFVTAAAMLALVAAPAVAQQTRSISASDKAQGAQANPELVKQYGGRYTGPQAAFVERVGKRVAVQSGLSNAQGDFTVTTLNSPVENAFAIPGGYIYVTRQLLALMNSEAELASVLGHEVGHVAARHSQSRNTRSTIGSILAAGAGLLTGSNIATQLVGTGAQLYTLKYGRDQEYQADGLGIRYMTAAGYDPYASADMLASLAASSNLAARTSGKDANAIPTWASTHPNSADRVRRAASLAQQTGRPETTPPQDTAFLRMLDGLPYGDDPKEGVVDGQSFRHPGLKLKFTAPTGYAIANGSDAVTIAGQGGQAEMRLGQGSDLGQAIAQRFGQLGTGTPSGQVQNGTANGIPYAYVTTRAAANNRAVDATVVAYRFPSATYTFTLVTPAGSGIGPFQPLLASVAPLSTAEANAIRGKKISIVTVRQGDTIDSLSARMAFPDYKRERFVTLNGLDSEQALVPGRLVKLVVNG